MGNSMCEGLEETENVLSVEGLETQDWTKDRGNFEGQVGSTPVMISAFRGRGFGGTCRIGS